VRGADVVSGAYAGLRADRRLFSRRLKSARHEQVDA
jgi:hypothetical protein